MAWTGLLRGVSAVVVVLTALAVVAGAARADTTGTVTGHVTDANGTPLVGICIEANTVPYPGAGYGGPVTDANGDYAFSLPPGTYAISFQGCGQNYVNQFYPGQADVQSAGHVPVTAGQTTGGIDAHMAVGGTITGTVVDQGTGTPPPQSEIAPVAELVGPGSPAYNPFVYGGVIRADGTFTITGLAPGGYRVHFDVTGNGAPSPYADAWYPDAPDPGHATVVSVQTRQTISLGVELAEAPGTVTGRVMNLAGAPLAGYVVGASITEPDGSSFPTFDFTTTGPDGTFTLTDLAPGMWSISANHNGNGEYVKSQPATVQTGGTTSNVDFMFCAGTECPPTRLLALSTRIHDHAIAIAGQISDPANALMTVVLRGRIKRRTVRIPIIGFVARAGTFEGVLSLPGRDRGLRTGVLTLDFAPSEAARGGRFVVKVPSVYPGPVPRQARPHRHRRKSKRRHSHSIGGMLPLHAVPR